MKCSGKTRYFKNYLSFTVCSIWLHFMLYLRILVTYMYSIFGPVYSICTLYTCTVFLRNKLGTWARCANQFQNFTFILMLLFKMGQDLRKLSLLPKVGKNKFC